MEEAGRAEDSGDCCQEQSTAVRQRAGGRVRWGKTDAKVWCVQECRAQGCVRQEHVLLKPVLQANPPATCHHPAAWLCSNGRLGLLFEKQKCPAVECSAAHHDPALADDREHLLVQFAGHAARQAQRVARPEEGPQQLRGCRAAGRAAQDGQHRVQQLGVGGGTGGSDTRGRAPADGCWLPVVTGGPCQGQHASTAWRCPACSHLVLQPWCAKPCKQRVSAAGCACRRAARAREGQLVAAAAARGNTQGGRIPQRATCCCGSRSAAASAVWALTSRQRPSGQTRLTEHPGCFGGFCLIVERCRENDNCKPVLSDDSEVMLRAVKFQFSMPGMVHLHRVFGRAQQLQQDFEYRF